MIKILYAIKYCVIPNESPLNDFHLVHEGAFFLIGFRGISILVNQNAVKLTENFKLRKAIIMKLNDTGRTNVLPVTICRLAKFH
jgi:hypothetical protein